MAKIKNLLSVAWTRIKSALREESTWRGLIALATAAGATISPDTATSIIAVGMALIGGINVVKKETPVAPADPIKKEE